MTSRSLLASVALATALAASCVLGALGARPVTPSISVVAPLHVERGGTTAVALRLPANVAAVEGRLFVDQRAVEVIGVAPRGGGTALRPVDAGEGAYTLAAYGLRPVNGHTTLDLVVYPKEAGRLQVRVVIDAAADKNGHRLALGRFNQLATLGVGSQTGTIAAPQAGAASVPTRAAQATREIVIDGRFNSQDLDAVRGDWYARLPGHACDADMAADANSDGCVDVVDLQAQLAAQGQLSAAPAPAAPLAVAALNVTFVVNSTADTPDAANGNGVCADSLGQCTLRAAITEAGWLPGDDRIEFALTGPAPVTIQLSSRLPDISSTNGALTIDGYSQPGSQVNTATVGSNAIMGVQIRGNGQAAREFLYITSANNTIRGLLFSNVYRGFFLDSAGAHDNHIIGNWIGFQKDGTSPGQGNVGVVLNYGSNHNFVGQPNLADRNVIGNMTLGADIYGTGTEFNVIQNNVLCIRPSGFTGATCSTGVDHNFGPKNNLVGGTGVNEKNVIGPTTLQGLEISHGFDPSTHAYNGTWNLSGNRLVGNWVGFRGDGSYNAAFRSGLASSTADNANGINVYDGTNDNIVEGNFVASAFDGIQIGLHTTFVVGNIVRNNTIGVSPLGENAPLAGWGIISRGNGHHNTFESNTIRNAARGGIGLTNVANNGAAETPVYNTKISQNIITNTNGPAIDLYGPAGGGGAGPDPNDAGDVDTGANTQVNTPIFTSVTAAGAAGTAYAGSTVELFRASRPVGQFGLPTAYLGSAVVAGNGTWTIAVSLALGDIVTALQIRPDLSTSELAANVAATTGVPNQAPVFTTEFGDRTDLEGASVNFDANATDPEGATLTYSASDLPGGISINSSNGVVSGTLNNTSAGVYSVVLTVSDGFLADTDSFTWTVTDNNQAPVFSTDFGDRTDAEGVSVNLDANATDPNGDTLAYSATNLPAGISINSANGVISGTLTFAAAGTYSVVVTVSDGTLTDTDPFTWTVTESTVTVYANDDFSRTLVNSWGSATSGGSYTLQGDGADYDVVGGFGTIALTAAGANRSAVLAGVSALDVDLSFRVRTDKTAAGGAQFIYGLARRISSTTEYRAKLRLAPNGSVFIQASSVVGNTETPIGSEVQVAGLTHTAGNFIWVRAQFSGSSPTTIQMRAWADGSAEPGTWQYTATNSVAALQSAGAVGVRGYLSGATTNAPVILTFDDFRAASIGGP